MAGLDARFVFSETATAHMHTIKVVIVRLPEGQRRFSEEDLALILEDRMSRLAVLRRLLVRVPLDLANPVVIDDPDFDVRRHIERVSLAAPGGQRELAAAIAAAASTPLPQDRPLWSLTLVDGLADNQMAFVMKLHHALADGRASVALLANAFVLDDSAVVEPYQPEPRPGTRALLGAAAGALVTNAKATPSIAVRTVTGFRSRRAARREIETATHGPFAGPRTPFNVALTADRTFAMVDLPLPDLLACKQARGTSLNDVFLALCGGGVRRYLDGIDGLPEQSVIASVPVGTGADIPHLEGNHVDNLFVALHSELADPLDRLQRVHEGMRAARRAQAAFGHELFEERNGILPPVTHKAMSKVWSLYRLAHRVRPPVNMVASNVAGPRRVLGMAGSEITALYSVGPILEGIGLNITAWSYGDRLHLSLLGCPRSLPDPWRLADAITDEFHDLRRAALGAT